MEPFEFVRSPVQSEGLARAGIPVPPPIMSNQVLDENIIQERINDGHEYLHRLEDRRNLHECSLGDKRGAKRYKMEVQAAALVRPILRIIPQANGNEGDGLILQQLRQEIQLLQRASQQQLEAIQLVNQQLQAMQRRSERQLQDMQLRSEQQFETLQFNMGALAFNSSALLPQVPIRPLKNNAGRIPRHFPGTRGEFKRLNENRVQALLDFYGIPRPGQGEELELLASHVGLRAVE